jgi:hypothetical protein
MFDRITAIQRPNPDSALGSEGTHPEAGAGPGVFIGAAVYTHAGPLLARPLLLARKRNCLRWRVASGQPFVANPIAGLGRAEALKGIAGAGSARDRDGAAQLGTTCAAGLPAARQRFRCHWCYHLRLWSF